MWDFYLLEFRKNVSDPRLFGPGESRSDLYGNTKSKEKKLSIVPKGSLLFPVGCYRYLQREGEKGDIKEVR
jgi:hypothetical protein